MTLASNWLSDQPLSERAPTMGTVKLGLDTFGDVTVDLQGERLPHAQVLRNVLAEAVLADEVGVDAFGIGEHHRDDFAVSAPDIVLAAAASRPERIILGTARSEEHTSEL